MGRPAQGRGGVKIQHLQRGKRHEQNDLEKEKGHTGWILTAILNGAAFLQAAQIGATNFGSPELSSPTRAAAMFPGEWRIHSPCPELRCS